MNQNTKLILIAAGFALILLTIIICAICIARSLRRDRDRVQRRENELQGRNVEKLNQSMAASMRQIAELSGALDARMEALTRANDQKLDEMRRMVGEKLEGRLTESFRVVNGQLADVHKGIGEMRELAANVTDLKKVLGNVKTRGVWGEVLLKNILAEMFAPGQYSENAAIPEGSLSRVEFALHMPNPEGKPVLMPIDSKFPQEDYVRLMDAEASGDAALREKCARMLERALIEQAKIISEKYIRPPQTTDYAVMFLPAEGLYAEAARCPGLIERVQGKYRVLIAGPSTLCALLTSLQMGFRTSALEQRSGEILQLFDELRVEFGRFQEGIVKVRQKINQAESELDAMENRARKIGKKLM